MSEQSWVFGGASMIRTHLPQVSLPQARVVALWS
jgi:hypothetical protein